MRKRCEVAIEFVLTFICGVLIGFSGCVTTMVIVAAGYEKRGKHETDKKIDEESERSS